VVSLSDDHQRALEEISERLVGVMASEALSEILEMITAGAEHIISPKLSAAAAIAKKEMAKNHSCVLVTRSKRAATLLRSMLRPIPIDMVEPGAPAQPVKGRVSIVRFEKSWPDLRGFDHVVILDYPWSLAVIDEAVGAASATGADRVTLIHASDSVDDRLAVLASRRREISGIGDDSAPPTLEEISYLVEPRS